MRGAERPVAAVLAAILLAVGAVGVVDAQPISPSAGAGASIKSYLPELQRLQQKDDWVGLEQLSRQALAAVRAAQGPNAIDVGGADDWLARALLGQGRYGEAEQLFRQELAIDDKIGGSTSVTAANVQSNLANSLQSQGRFAEAEPLYRNALAIYKKVLGPDHPTTAIGMNNLGALLSYGGRFAESETMYRGALAIDEKALGPEHPDTAARMINFANLLEARGRYGEAEPLYRGALDIFQKVLPPDDLRTAAALECLSGLLQDEGRFAEAEALDRRGLAIFEKIVGPNHTLTASGLANLAAAIEEQGRFGEAEPLDRRALAINQAVLGADNAITATDLNNLGAVVFEQGRYDEAEPFFRSELAIDQKTIGPDQPITANTEQWLGQSLRMQMRFADASGLFRVACSTRLSAIGSPTADAEETRKLKKDAGRCARGLSLSLWGWSRQGGGVDPADRPDALRDEAMLSAQAAVQSASGDAVARALAVRLGGADAQNYEAGLGALATLNIQLAAAAGMTGPGGAETRQALSTRRDAEMTEIARLAGVLKATTPRYWDLRSPQPVSVAALQATSGPDAVLLHANEAIVLWLAPPGKDKGLVFAVSKTGVAWAQIGLSGDDLDARVKALRAEVDPQGLPTDQPFDRKVAHDLYVALLGDPAIQQVIAGPGVDTLLIAPSGSLTSLPPSLLVVDEPNGSDTDPQAIRSTHWLIRDKAIAILPAVSSLRTLRAVLPQARAQSGVKSDLPLLALADPDFHGDDVIPTAPAGMAPAMRSVPTAGAATVDGRPKAQVLADLPPLYGTLAEGHALATLLDAPDQDLLLGPAASKTELLARQGDGTLVRTRVIAFSTHGLVTGDFTGLTEPALALAHPPAHADPSDDGLLTASQAAGLTLDADWVVLSACNTASPEAPGAEGLSGLARAFFYAGADSLLVSHWRVRDDAAMRIVTETFRLRQADSKLSKAKALQKSIISLLNDQSLDAKPGQTFANPQAWAPFVVVGEPD